VPLLIRAAWVAAFEGKLAVDVGIPGRDEQTVSAPRTSSATLDVELALPLCLKRHGARATDAQDTRQTHGQIVVSNEGRHEPL
jgi:hypothetical protein